MTCNLILRFRFPFQILVETDRRFDKLSLRFVAVCLKRSSPAGPVTPISEISLCITIFSRTAVPCLYFSPRGEAK